MQEAQVAAYARTEDDAMFFMWSAACDNLNRTNDPALKALVKVLTAEGAPHGLCSRREWRLE